MNPALYYKVYREGVNKQIILRYIGYPEPCYLYNLTKDYIWGD